MVSLLLNHLKEQAKNELEESLKEYFELVKKVETADAVVANELHELQNMKDTIEDMQSLANEKVTDKVTKKRASKISLANATDIYSYEKETLINEVEILKSLTEGFPQFF